MSIKSIINFGYEFQQIDIECSLTKSLPAVTIVGMAAKAVDEAKERLRSAIMRSDYVFPRKKIILNLAPAELPKNTASLDLAMAISILQSDKQIVASLKNHIFIGELGLEGQLRPVRGLLGKINNKLSRDCKAIFIPIANAAQASLLGYSNIYAVNNLREVVEHLNGTRRINPITPKTNNNSKTSEFVIDFNDIQGQNTAKRALEIAATGGHNVLMSGPPGTGKSMLAKAFIDILPPLSCSESIEVTHLHSLVTNNFEDIITTAPMRSPHHSASNVAISGGGHNLRPGEISLAHHGVLFLDELPEFGRYTIESLRQPLEDKVISISRAQQTAIFPANFILIATSNPCPCGYLYSAKSCECTAAQIQHYQKKLSGPIIDRIDIHVTVDSVEHKNLLKTSDDSETPKIRSRVQKARKIQYERQNGKLNSDLTNRNLKNNIHTNERAIDLLNKAASSLELSARSYMRVIKIARSIADLEESLEINEVHIAEALQYRPKTNFL